MSFVLAITGPAGSGKSTVAKEVAKLVKQCVNIDVDYVKHFIVNSFVYDHSSNEGIEQWKLLGDNIGLLTNNFLKSGYNVIINGFLDESAWIEVERHISITHKVILLPDIDISIQRDGERHEDYIMGEEIVKAHRDQFSNSGFYKNFIKIDTSSHNVDETVSNILKIING
jgi:cytidylate kinase